MTPSTQDLRAAIGNWSLDALVASTNEAAEVGGVSVDEIKSADRCLTVARARQGAMWLAYRRGVSKRQIAHFFGRDWSTVSYAIKAAQDRYDSHNSTATQREVS